MNKKTWGIFIGIVVVVIAGMIYISTRDRLDVSDVAESSNKILATEDRNGNIGEHVFGNPDAKTLMIEYGDFQCNPGCRLFHENIDPILKDTEYMKDVAFVYRNFPITNIHPNAIAAASSAEAAGLQGKYWEMWNSLFTNQAEWGAASVSERSKFFEEYARNIGLDIDKFHADSQSDAVSKKIQFDRAIGGAAKISGTPTVFLNGKQLEGDQINSTEAIRKALDEAKSDNK